MKHLNVGGYTIKQFSACGSETPPAWQGHHTVVREQVACDACLVALDIMLAAGLASIPPRKGKRHVIVIDNRAFPHAPASICPHRYVVMRYVAGGSTALECEDCGELVDESARWPLPSPPTREERSFAATLLGIDVSQLEPL